MFSRSPEIVDVVIRKYLGIMDGPVGAHIGIPLAYITDELRVGHERPRAYRLAVLKLGRHHLRRCKAMLRPDDQGRHEVENIRHIAAAAVMHAGHHEDTGPITRFLQPAGLAGYFGI